MACKDCGFMTPEEKEARKDIAFATKIQNIGLFYTEYGHCPKCTPKKYRGMISDLQDVKIDAGREWDAKMAPKRKEYITKKSAGLTKRILKLYNGKRPEGTPELTEVPTH